MRSGRSSSSPIDCGVGNGAVGNGVAVGELVAVGISVAVDVAVAVAAGVGVSVDVAVAAGVLVAVGVFVGNKDKAEGKLPVKIKAQKPHNINMRMTIMPVHIMVESFINTSVTSCYEDDNTDAEWGASKVDTQIFVFDFGYTLCYVSHNIF